MKKHIGLIFRLIVAAAGIGFIIYSLNWSDHVELPADYVVAPGTAGGEAGRAYPVLEETDDALRIGGEDASAGSDGQAVWLAKSELGVEPDEPRFSPSVMTTLKQADARLLLFGGLLYGPTLFIGSLRWFMLMRARGMAVPYRKAFRLTMVGVFFNLCFPGSTGGDVMKAYYAAKGSDQRSTAVVTVVVDRICGLLGLILLVSLLGLFMLNQEMVREITISMWGILIGLIVFGYVYTHEHLRRTIGVDWLLSKLPGGRIIGSVDQAIVAYRDHKREVGLGVLMSMPIHLCVAGSMVCAAYAFGVTHPVVFMLTALPVAILIGALPISGPLGLGAMDITAVALLADSTHATAHQIAMMLVIYRLYAVGYGLLGSTGMLKGDIHLHPQTPEASDENAGLQAVAGSSTP